MIINQFQIIFSIQAKPIKNHSCMFVVFLKTENPSIVLGLSWFLSGYNNIFKCIMPGSIQIICSAIKSSLSWLTIIYESVVFIFYISCFHLLLYQFLYYEQQRKIIFYNRHNILQWNESNNSFILGKMTIYEEIDKVVHPPSHLCRHSSF